MQRQRTLVLNATTVVSRPPVQNKLGQVRWNLQGPQIRHDTLQGRPYLVVPMIMITEGVHNGSAGAIYYPGDELEKTPEVWNTKPIVIYHPQINGEGVSACSPEVLNAQCVGMILGARTTRIKAKNKAGVDEELVKLAAEAWLEKERLTKVDDRVLNALEKGEMVEVSTGLFMDVETVENGSWRGESYQVVARNHKPDHLAILPDQKGACSIADGAGLLRLNGDGEEEDVMGNAWSDEARAAALAARRKHATSVGPAQEGKGTTDVNFKGATEKAYLQAEGSLAAKGFVRVQPYSESLYQHPDGTTATISQHGSKKPGALAPPTTTIMFVEGDGTVHTRIGASKPAGNAWTEEARKKALEARRAHAKGTAEDSGGTNHDDGKTMPVVKGDPEKMVAALKKRGFVKDDALSDAPGEGGDSHQETWDHPDGTQATVSKHGTTFAHGDPPKDRGKSSGKSADYKAGVDASKDHARATADREAEQEKFRARTAAEDAKGKDYGAAADRERAAQARTPLPGAPKFRKKGPKKNMAVIGNAWSDEARAAAAAARKRKMVTAPGAPTGRPASTPTPSFQDIDSHMTSMGGKRVVGGEGVPDSLGGAIRDWTFDSHEKAGEVWKGLRARGVDAKWNGRTLAVYVGMRPKNNAAVTGTVGNRTTHKELPMNKEALVNKLIANGDVFDEGDREFLMSKTVEQLTLLTGEDETPTEGTEDLTEPTTENRAGALVGNTTVKKPTVQEYIENAPPEIRDMLGEGLRSAGELRKNLVGKITSNAAADYSKEELAAMSMRDLRRVAKLCGAGTVENAQFATFEGMADAFGAAGTVQNNVEPLPLPSWDGK